MSRKITKVISFKIENKFDKWVKFFESKVICIHQAPEGNIQKIVQANIEWIKSHKVDFSTME